jgi:hypothetical protein
MRRARLVGVHRAILPRRRTAAAAVRAVPPAGSLVVSGRGTVLHVRERLRVRGLRAVRAEFRRAAALVREGLDVHRRLSGDGALVRYAVHGLHGVRLREQLRWKRHCAVRR